MSKSIDYRTYANFQYEMCFYCEHNGTGCNPVSCPRVNNKLQQICSQKNYDVRIGNFVFKPVGKSGESMSTRNKLKEIEGILKDMDKSDESVNYYFLAVSGKNKEEFTQIGLCKSTLDHLITMITMSALDNQMISVAIRMTSAFLKGVKK